MFEKSMTRVIVGIRESIFYVCVCCGGGGGLGSRHRQAGRKTNKSGGVLATDRLDRETNKSRGVGSRHRQARQGD